MKSIRPLKEIKDTAILLIHCPDRQGILATVTEFLNKNNGNIIYLDQHVDRQEMTFYMRVEWELKEFSIPREKIGEYFDILIASHLDDDLETLFSRKRFPGWRYLSRTCPIAFLISWHATLPGSGMWKSR